MNTEDKQLKGLFLELKREDEKCAPPFDDVLRAAGARQRTVPTGWTRIVGVAAVAGLCLLGMLLAHWQRSSNRSSTPTETPAASLNPGGATDLPWQSLVLASQWHSPTDFLLNAPEDPPASRGATASEISEGRTTVGPALSN